MLDFFKKLSSNIYGLDGAGLSRREALAALGLAGLGAACSGPYLMPERARLGAGVDPNEPPPQRYDYFERDVSAYLPEGLTGRYYFGGGYLGGELAEPQSTLVALDAERGVLRRAAYTYAVRRGQPFTSLGGADARAVLDVVHQIGGHIHQVVPVPERGEVYFFPASGAWAVVDDQTLELKGSGGDRVFYADNFSAHPWYDAEERAIYYTRMDVLANLGPSLDGAPERYRHSLVRRDVLTGEESVVMDGIEGAIVHAVARSPDGSTGVIVFTGDGIRKPFGARGGADDTAARAEATARASRVVLFRWRERRIYGELPTAAVPVHVEFAQPGPGGEQHLFVQCTNATFVDHPPTWYGTGAYQKLRVDEGHLGLVAQYNDARTCNVPHSLKLDDQDRLLWSTNADSQCVLALDPGSMEARAAVPFTPISQKHDQNPRGIEQSMDGRYLIVSSNTSIHFYDLLKQRWAGRPIGVIVGERHAHIARSA